MLSHNATLLWPEAFLSLQAHEGVVGLNDVLHHRQQYSQLLLPPLFALFFLHLVFFFAFFLFLLSLLLRSRLRLVTI